MIEEIVVGSKSIVKFNAVRKGCDRVSLDVPIDCIDAESGVANQPYMMWVIVSGAMRRAYTAHESNRKALALGIENGLMLKTGRTEDVGVVVGMHSDLPGGKVIRVTEGVVVPHWVVQACAQSGFTRTFGQVLAEKYPECVHDNPHVYLTNGKHSREDLLADAIEQILRMLV